MKLQATLLASALISCAVTSSALARGGDGACKAACPTQAAEASVTNASFTAVAPQDANTPMMRCLVGKQVFECVIEANKASKESGESVTYVVSGIKYDDPAEAGRAFERRLQSAIYDATTVRISVANHFIECPVDAQRTAKETGQPLYYRVGNTYFQCDQAARQAAARALAAVESVHMTYKVGAQSYDCPDSACAASKASGEAVTYVIAIQSTCCDILASCMLAKAQLAAATNAITTQGGHS